MVRLGSKSLKNAELLDQLVVASTTAADDSNVTVQEIWQRFNAGPDTPNDWTAQRVTAPDGNGLQIITTAFVPDLQLGNVLMFVNGQMFMPDVSIGVYWFDADEIGFESQNVGFEIALPTGAGNDQRGDDVIVIYKARVSP